MIRLAREARVDASLQANLRGAALPRLDRAAHDLRDVEQIGSLGTFVLSRALRERAEGAAVAADIGVIDVAVDDVGRDVAVGPGAQLIGRLADAVKIVAARIEQRGDRIALQIFRAMLAHLIDDGSDAESFEAPARAHRNPAAIRCFVRCATDPRARASPRRKARGPGAAWRDRARSPAISRTRG